MEKRICDCMKVILLHDFNLFRQKISASFLVKWNWTYPILGYIHSKKG